MGRSKYLVELREQDDGVILWRIILRNRNGELYTCGDHPSPIAPHTSSRNQGKIRRHLAWIMIPINGRHPGVAERYTVRAPVASILREIEASDTRYVDPSINAAVRQALSKFLVLRAVRDGKGVVEQHQRRAMTMRRSARRNRNQREGDIEGIRVERVDATEAEDKLKADVTLRRYRCRVPSGLRKFWMLEEREKFLESEKRKLEIEPEKDHS
ncbi:uncharacterized protein BP5553_02706 [Venustampulla echinocandica]|uniref:Uncharacterized protein n=1 Tax=Venustampulla echinocandica TaxID=2656787 RepID=A0A370TS59_9HELO|nr:uncharacterized protein BP5553_02706 [Venustampulla echinocandica]RDL38366.1 hypothetical protein BP5553_02706 [Venustampulla echinocandica]